MAEKLGYYHIPVGLELPNSHENAQLDNVVIIVAGSGSQLFKQMLKIALKEDNTLELRKKDTKSFIL